MNLWQYYSDQQEKQIQEPISVSHIWCLSKNAIVSKDTIFYLLWYNVIVEAVMYTKKSFFSLFPQFIIFSE